MNTFKTTVLLATLTALFMAVGFLIGGWEGMAFAFLLAVAINANSYWNGASMALHVHDAREPQSAAELSVGELVEDLARRAGLPAPRLYMSDDDKPNALAVGRDADHAAIIVTTGILRTLTKDELAGVLAHELAHIKNRDTLLMTVTATLVGAIAVIAGLGLMVGMLNRRHGGLAIILFAVVAPIGAMVLQMAISRNREYVADRIGAEICGHPEWVASALRKLGSADTQTAIEKPQQLATASLMFVTPLPDDWFASLFDTHPPVALRIARLESMVNGG